MVQNVLQFFPCEGAVYCPRQPDRSPGEFRDRLRDSPTDLARHMFGANEMNSFANVPEMLNRRATQFLPQLYDVPEHFAAGWWFGRFVLGPRVVVKPSPRDAVVCSVQFIFRCNNILKHNLFPLSPIRVAYGIDADHARSQPFELAQHALLYVPRRRRIGGSRHPLLGIAVNVFLF